MDDSQPRVLIPRPKADGGTTGMAFVCLRHTFLSLHIVWTLRKISLNLTQMFLLLRLCAEPMTPLPRLNQGQSSRVMGNGIYPWILWPLHISWTISMISLNLKQMFLSLRWCAEPLTWPHRLKVKDKPQGHVIYPSFCVYSISPEPFGWFSLNFTQMFLSVRWSWDLSLNFMSAPYLRNNFNDFHSWSVKNMAAWGCYMI